MKPLSRHLRTIDPSPLPLLPVATVMCALFAFSLCLSEAQPTVLGMRLVPDQKQDETIAKNGHADVVEIVLSRSEILVAGRPIVALRHGYLPTAPSPRSLPEIVSAVKAQRQAALAADPDAMVSVSIETDRLVPYATVKALLYSLALSGIVDVELREHNAVSAVNHD